MGTPSRTALWLTAFLVLGRVLAADATPADRTRLTALGDNRPLAFEENRGQTDPRVKYLARGDGYTLFLTSVDAVLALRGSDSPVLRLRWAGGATAPRITAEGRLPGVTNYLTGKDPSRWRSGVPSWTRVHYEEVWPGIDLVFYGNPRQLEHDVVVAPSADPGRVRLAFEGAEELRIEANGDLVARVGGEEVRLRRPVSYQEVGGARREVASGWQLLPGTREAGFRVAAYDRSRPLIIDPVLVYSTYLGGSELDGAYAIAADAGGNAYVAGWTNSEDFPLTETPPSRWYQNAFLVKLSPAGELVFATLFGGGRADNAYDIALDASGFLYVTGTTASPDFPLVNPLPPEYRQSHQGPFIAKLDPSGASFIYSTTLTGPPGLARPEALAVDPQGNAYILGLSSAPGFPLRNPLQDAPRGSIDLILAKLGPSGSTLIYSTYLGASQTDWPGGIVADAEGNAYVTGYTFSNDFPRVNALPMPRATIWRSQAFIAKVTSDGSALAWSTLLGGNAGNDFGRDVALGRDGNLWVAGATSSTDFPVVNALQPVLRGSADAFVAKLGPGPTLLTSTFFGGSKADVWDAIAIDSVGNLALAGVSESPDWPLQEPVQSTCAPVDRTGRCHPDAVATVLDPQASRVLFSTLLGGTAPTPGNEARDFGSDVAVDAAGNLHVAGITHSTDFPTVNALQPEHSGQPEDAYDAFVARIELGTANRPPDCSAAFATPATLWPPNGRIVPIAITGVTDPDGDAVSITITRITQDEPLTGRGPDATGAGTSTASVRATRSGRGDGRVYHITFEARDPMGAACTGTVTVCVPHDRGKPTCGDGGPLVDSTR